MVCTCYNVPSKQRGEFDVILTKKDVKIMKTGKISTVAPVTRFMIMRPSVLMLSGYDQVGESHIDIAMVVVPLLVPFLSETS